MSLAALFRLSISRRWWWTTLLVLLAATAMTRLGIWQLDRRETRRQFNQHVGRVQSAPVLDLTAELLPADLVEQEYRAASAGGVYDFESQIALRNQYWGEPDGPAEYGYRLITPLVLADGTAVLVDRGWIPAGYADPASWERFDQPAPDRLTGILRLPLAEGEMGGGVADPPLAPGEVRRTWNNLDLAALQSQIPHPLLPVYLQLAPEAEPQALPYRRLPDLELTEGPHLGYALQWFFYAGLVLVGYPVYLRRQAAA